MDNSNNTMKGIPEVNFSLRLLPLQVCSQGILERSIYCHSLVLVYVNYK